MPEFVSFNTTVSRRTLVAEHVLRSPGTLALFERFGGLREDVEAIVAAGKRALSGRVGRDQATAMRRGSVRVAREKFASLRREHLTVLAVLEIVTHELARDGAPALAFAQARAVLSDETERRVRPQANARGERVYRARGLEAVRAEVERDAQMLLAHAELHERLARRGVSRARLEALRQETEALGSQLTLRTVREGKRVSALGEERAAVREQKERWSLCYRMLRRAAREDPGLATLLREAAGRRRRRRKKSG